ncbi:methyltransferase domain-containing protein [Jatrophihabitans sp.]|uniref:methyltransferase domain-containing protein n=1 Tax=Jatrophihabitans sp. TaxID=1932789 RepID=UPI002EF8670D
MVSDAPDQAAGGTQLSTPVAAWSPRGRSPLLWAGLQRILQDWEGAAAPRVLDCGGGSGSLAVPLAAQGAVVTVVDVSIDALATLMRRAAEAGVSDRIAAVQGEAESLAQLVRADDFDLVLAHDVLEDVQNPVLVVDQIATVLRPGGVLSVVVANPVAGVLARVLTGDVTGALAAFSRPAPQAYDVTVLVNQCLAAGLQVQSVEGLGVFTDLVPGIELERPGAIAALAELESAVAGQPPYRDIASRLHVQARRPVAG